MHAHDQLRRRLFAMEDRAVRLQKVAVAPEAVQLPPGTATGMTVGAQIAQPQPPPVVTARMRTKVLRGVNDAWAPVGRGHGVGRRSRGRLSLRSVVLTQDTMGFLCQPLKRFRLVGAGALGWNRLRLG